MVDEGVRDMTNEISSGFFHIKYREGRGNYGHPQASCHIVRDDEGVQSPQDSSA